MIGGHSNNPIYISEHLAPYDAKLYQKARQLRKTNVIKYLWTRDGKIMVRIRDGEQTLADLSNLENESRPRMTAMGGRKPMQNGETKNSAP